MPTRQGEEHVVEGGGVHGEARHRGPLRVDPVEEVADVRGRRGAFSSTDSPDTDLRWGITTILDGLEVQQQRRRG